MGRVRNTGGKLWPVRKRKVGRTSVMHQKKRERPITSKEKAPPSFCSKKGKILVLLDRGEKKDSGEKRGALLYEGDRLEEEKRRRRRDNPIGSRHLFFKEKGEVRTTIFRQGVSHVKGAYPRFKRRDAKNELRTPRALR